jgi:hypothetical protein
VPVNDTTFEAEVLKSPVPVLVDFWAPWCGPCRMIAPLIDELATEYEGKLKAVRGFIACVQGGALAASTRHVPTSRRYTTRRVSTRPLNGVGFGDDEE